MVIPKCEKCSIALAARHKVVDQRPTPADILFMGEAPGKSEDLLGEPFVGPSGKLLQTIIEETTINMNLESPPSYYIINTILCRPFIEDENSDDYFDNREPTEIEVLNCTKIVMDIIRRVKPKYTVFVGKFSEKYYKKTFQISSRIYHPSYLLRTGGKNSPYYLSTIRMLEDVFKSVMEFK